MDAIEMLKDPHLLWWKRMPFALIILVDGVKICGNKNLKITPVYVEMLSDLDYFMEYPWGRVLFSKTLSRFGLSPCTSAIPNPISELRARLQANKCMLWLSSAFAADGIRIHPPPANKNPGALKCEQLSEESLWV